MYCTTEYRSICSNVAKKVVESRCYPISMVRFQCVREPLRGPFFTHSAYLVFFFLLPSMMDSNNLCATSRTIKASFTITLAVTTKALYSN